MNDGKAMIQFDIQDTGIGMSEEFIQHIFEPFVQEHENMRFLKLIHPNMFPLLV